jgi:hypothetical protein
LIDAAPMRKNYASAARFPHNRPFPVAARSHAPAAALLLGGVVAGSLAGLPGTPCAAAPLNARATMDFAAEMAREGNWREAKYRWELVLEQEDDNPRLLNNLAVASEALGQIDEATYYYERAIGDTFVDDRIRDNHRRFTRFVEAVRPEAPDDDAAAVDFVDAPGGGANGTDSAGEPVEGDDGKSANNEKKNRKKAKKGKTARVSIQLPVPPRLDVEGMSSLLVASFVAEDSSFLDVNRELTAYLRREFRKRCPLEVIEAVPAPAIPEQSLEDLLGNETFWKHLAREYGADLIVSGVVSYDRSDVSGFRDVDVVNSATGQKVRETRFVEQEEFAYRIDVIFMDGATGTLLFRDRMQQRAIFQGSQNDPIAAFYELSDAIAGDVLGVITTRTRVEDRLIFKR